jgi:sortase (surface protein transpeptidase)
MTAACSSDPAPAAAPTVAGTSSIEPPPAAEAATTGPAPMAASTPVRIRIPAIGVDSGLMDLGLQSDGSLEVPPEGFPAGWYTGAPTPGELGPAIIAGHVDWNGSPGVFFALRDLTPGAEIAVERKDGSTAVFRVSSVEQFPKGEFPTDAVYADIDHAGLRLITCGGSFDRQARSYEDNIVVFAALSSS